MIIKIKKVCNWLLALFLATVGYLLLAMWRDWPFGTVGICAFLVLTVTVLVLMLIVAIAAIIAELRSKGFRKFASGFAVRVLSFGGALVLAGVWKKNFELGPVVLMTVLLSVINYYYSPQQPKK